MTSNNVPLPSAPPRSQAQRILDLTRERDRISRECLGLKDLLGRIRDAAFAADPGWQENVRNYLIDEWEAATAPGRVFDLMRSHDGTRVSGEGRVAEGIEFENGKVAMCWLGAYSSVTLYDSLEHVKHIHGHGGSTEVVFRNPEDKA